MAGTRSLAEDAMTRVRNARRICTAAGLALVFALAMAATAVAQQHDAPPRPAERPPTVTAPADPPPADTAPGPRRPSHEQDRSSDPWDMAPDCPYRERDLQLLVMAEPASTGSRRPG